MQEIRKGAFAIANIVYPYGYSSLWYCGRIAALGPKTARLECHGFDSTVQVDRRSIQYCFETEAEFQSAMVTFNTIQNEYWAGDLLLRQKQYAAIEEAFSSHMVIEL